MLLQQLSGIAIISILLVSLFVIIGGEEKWVNQRQLETAVF